MDLETIERILVVGIRILLFNQGTDWYALTVPKKIRQSTQDDRGMLQA